MVYISKIFIFFQILFISLTIDHRKLRQIHYCYVAHWGWLSVSWCRIIMSPKNSKTYLIRIIIFAASLIGCSFCQDICGTGDEYGLPIFTPADTGISRLPASYDPGTLQGYFSIGKSFMNSVQSRNFGKYLKGCKLIFFFQLVWLASHNRKLEHH